MVEKVLQRNEELIKLCSCDVDCGEKDSGKEMRRDSGLKNEKKRKKERKEN